MSSTPATTRTAPRMRRAITSTEETDAFGLGSVTAGTASAYAYGGTAGYREDGIAPTGLPSVYAFQKVGARYYDPTFGCFLSRDTDLGQSAYAYCGGDPVNESDPSGHSWAAGLAFVGGIVGAVITVIVLCFIGPELVVGVGVYAAIATAITVDPIATLAVTTVVGGGAVLYGTEIGENFDKQADRPEKTGGGPAAGDQTITGGEAEGISGSNGSGNYSTPVPTTYQDYNGETNKPMGSPYTGTPHYGPKP